MSSGSRRRHPTKFEPGVGVSPGQCPSTGKQRWEARSHARAHLRDLKTGDLRATLLVTYRHTGPDGCGDWHVGHRGRRG